MLVPLDTPNISALIQKTYEVDFNEELRKRFQLRTEQLPYLNQSEYHNILLLLCMEKMMASLQPATEKIPGMWAISDDATPTKLNINTLLIQILAWIPSMLIFPFRCFIQFFKFKLHLAQFRSEIKINGVVTSLAAPKPILCLVCEEVLLKKTDPVFAESIISQLIRYLRWILSHFDPNHRGLHSWRNQAESINPEISKPELATADLTALLLNEIECFERILLYHRNRSRNAQRFMLTMQPQLKSNFRRCIRGKSRTNKISQMLYTTRGTLLRLKDTHSPQYRCCAIHIYS